MRIANRLLLLASLVLITGAVVAFITAMRDPATNATSASTATSLDAGLATTDAYIESLASQVTTQRKRRESLVQLGAAESAKGT